MDYLDYFSPFSSLPETHQPLIQPRYGQEVHTAPNQGKTCHITSLHDHCGPVRTSPQRVLGGEAVSDPHTCGRWAGWGAFRPDYEGKEGWVGTFVFKGVHGWRGMV